MSDRFSWQTDDEGTWVQANRPPSRRPRWSLLLFIAFVVLGVGYGLYRFSLRQLELREQVIKGEIVAAHSTWLQAVDGNDLELLTMLSARSDANWYAAQRRLLSSGRMLDRSTLGLVSTNRPVAKPDITLSADLNGAELHFQESYVARDDSSALPIILEQTAFYERKGSSWAQRTLTEDEWGVTEQITSPRTLATYPERDRAIVGRIVSDLDRSLGTLCGEADQTDESVSPFCDEDGRVRIDFVTDPTALLNLTEGARPTLDGLDFRLPAPTLVGLPLDNAGYEALFHGYTDRILQTLQQVNAPSVRLPNQLLATLCYATSNNSLDLYNYAPEEGTWTAVGTDRLYGYLRPTPGDEGLILRAGPPGIDLDRLQLTLDEDGRQLQLVDVGRAELTASLADFAHNSASDELVLRFGHGSTGVADYALLPLDNCANAEACVLRGIEGFPLWAPGGESTIISDVGQLLLGDDQVLPRYSLGAGFSPFWLSSSVFGYVALSSADEGSDMRVVVQDLLTGQQKTVADSLQLMSELDQELGDRFRIRYVTSSPADPSLLLIGGSPSGSDAEDYLILSVRIEGDLKSVANLESAAPEVLLQLPDAPEGDPTTFTPTGSPAFTFSEDGRWLVAVRFVDKIFNTWELSLVDLQSRQTKVITTNYPPYPAQYPYFDWSADGEWLALMDNGFLRLIAPGSDYEKFVPHEYRDCTYSGWINE